MSRREHIILPKGVDFLLLAEDYILFLEDILFLAEYFIILPEEETLIILRRFPLNALEEKRYIIPDLEDCLLPVEDFLLLGSICSALGNEDLLL